MYVVLSSWYWGWDERKSDSLHVFVWAAAGTKEVTCFVFWVLLWCRSGVAWRPSWTWWSVGHRSRRFPAEGCTDVHRTFWRSDRQSRGSTRKQSNLQQEHRRNQLEPDDSENTRDKRSYEEILSWLDPGVLLILVSESDERCFVVLESQICALIAQRCS